jgi:hypothetical protein
MIAVAGFPQMGSAFAALSLGVAEVGTGQLALSSSVNLRRR